MVGRYGLPGTADLNWIRGIAGNRELLFLGDMDPVDLLVFAWLRERFRPQPVTHVGVNDTLLADLQIPLTDSDTIPLAPSEKDSLPVLEKVFPDLQETVGAQCAKLLTDGHKIELEALVSGKQSVADALRPILTPSSSA